MDGLCHPTVATLARPACYRLDPWAGLGTSWHMPLFLSNSRPGIPEHSADARPGSNALYFSTCLPGAHGVGLRPHPQSARGDAHDVERELGELAIPGTHIQTELADLDTVLLCVGIVVTMAVGQRGPAADVA